ncbi:salicylate hydroxylase [Fusarium sp. NRRL 52700]|nr:salicylate hydroxylase [Fusarium sp. NRRL 52700]
MGSLPSPGWKQLKVAVIGGGIAGMSAAIALRRAGHTVFIYERADFAGEAGASISCAANGTRWLNEWEVNLEKGDGVVLRKLISRDWTSGRVLSLYELDDYEERWGHLYYMFQRQCMHNMLKDSALGDGKGQPAKLFVNHKCKDINIKTGLVEFENGKQAKHDLIIGADGIGSTVRGILDIRPDRRPARSSCLHANVPTENALAAGLVDFSKGHALQFWGGQGELWDKIVLSPCRGGKLLSYYCFFPREKGDYLNHTWGGEDRSVDELLAPYPSLDPQVRAHLALGQDIQPWRLWTHQAACMAIEDAAALGILFGKTYFKGDVSEALSTYETIRLPRATKVQAAAARASENINERIGFSSNVENPIYKVKSEQEKLTIEEMNAYDMHMDIKEIVSKKTGQAFECKYIRGLPKGLKLSNGFTVGEGDLFSD